MKPTLAALALFTAVCLPAFAATPKPTSGASQPVPQTCNATTGDHSKYCSWKGGAFGTQGRECDIDVEKIDKDPCHFQSTTASEPSMADHAPICISTKYTEHIVFTSAQGRQFRIRRLVPLDNNPPGCPDADKHQPFANEFHKENFKFGSTFDTGKAKSGEVGCFYKLEVQFMTPDPNGPSDPYDPQPDRHLECRDPHLTITQ